MPHNRIRKYLDQQEVASIVPEGFVVCQGLPQMVNPAAQAMANADLYRQAREAAERQLAGKQETPELFSARN